MTLTYSQKRELDRKAQLEKRQRNRANGLCSCGGKRDGSGRLMCSNCRRNNNKGKNRTIVPGGLSPKQRERLGV